MRQHCDRFNDDQFFSSLPVLQFTFFIVISFVPVKIVYVICWNEMCKKYVTLTFIITIGAHLQTDCQIDDMQMSRSTC